VAARLLLISSLWFGDASCGLIEANGGGHIVTPTPRGIVSAEAAAFLNSLGTKGI
jgi:hypothetical protein